MIEKHELPSTIFTQKELNLMQEIGDEHAAWAAETPLRADAFEMADEQKMMIIEHHFREIMQTIGLDLTDDSLRGTPHRVAKMYVKEIFSGLNPKNKPSMTVFENQYRYNQMILERDITFFSSCEHHFVPIFGRAHVAYVSSGKVVGLSKLNRIVQYFAKRPQVQERLNMQIGEELQRALGTEDVAVILDARHMCVCSRGVQDVNSTTLTSFYGGKFLQESTRNEFLKYLEMPKIS
jgi:GTP cyclohydrolase IA